MTRCLSFSFLRVTRLPTTTRSGPLFAFTTLFLSGRRGVAGRHVFGEGWRRDGVGVVQGPGTGHWGPAQPWGAAAVGVAESRRTLRRVGRGFAPDMHLDSARAVGGVAPTYGRTHGP